MKTSFILLTLAASALLLAGCDTIGHRIKEKQTAFDSLTPVEQNTIKQGIVEPGFTPDMAYMAMGEPDDVTRYNDFFGHPITEWVYTRIEANLDYGSSYLIYDFDYRYASSITDISTYSVRLSPPITTYSVKRSASITFRDGKVSSVWLESPPSVRPTNPKLPW